MLATYMYKVHGSFVNNDDNYSIVLVLYSAKSNFSDKYQIANIYVAKFNGTLIVRDLQYLTCACTVVVTCTCRIRILHGRLKVLG